MKQVVSGCHTRRLVLSKLQSENLAVRLLIDSKWVLLVERWVSYPPRHMAARPYEFKKDKVASISQN